jgi:hypothetical protein
MNIRHGFEFLGMVAGIGCALYILTQLWAAAWRLAGTHPKLVIAVVYAAVAAVVFLIGAAA